jgi:thiol-disulfide isomerase/thioredoxin
VISAPELLKDARGLPVLLVFFKVTCPTCRLTWPYLQRLHAAYGGKAVRVVGVAQDDLPAARAFSDELGATFEIVLDPPPYEASSAFGVESVPHGVLLSEGGSREVVFAGWSRSAFEALGARLADAQGVPRAALIAEGEAVPAFKPG